MHYEVLMIHDGCVISFVSKEVTIAYNINFTANLGLGSYLSRLSTILSESTVDHISGLMN